MKTSIKKSVKRIIRLFQYHIKTPVYIPVQYGTQLQNRNILITGGAGGIGKAIAINCLRNGASVVITGRDIDKLEKVKNELLLETISDSQQVCVLTIDMLNVNQFETAISQAVKLLQNKKLDTLINNAGVDAGGVIGTTTEEQFDKTMNTNLKGTYFMSQAFANYCVQNKIEGNILNISSASGTRPVITPYMYSKWSITGLTKGLAKKYIKNNIVVNGIAPGPVATKMLGLDGSNLHYDNSPSQRYADPIEVANLAVFLISKAGQMIVGETIYLTGGCGTLTYDDLDY